MSHEERAEAYLAEEWNIFTSHAGRRDALAAQFAEVEAEARREEAHATLGLHNVIAASKSAVDDKTKVAAMVAEAKEALEMSGVKPPEPCAECGKSPCESFLLCGARVINRAGFWGMGFDKAKSAKAAMKAIDEAVAAPTCDCGARVAKTTHAGWCRTRA